MKVSIFVVPSMTSPRLIRSLAFGLLALFFGLLLGSASTGPAWHHEPFRIRVGAEFLDTARSHPSDAADEVTMRRNAVGHAGPFMADLDRDGKRDLVVGTFAGRFRLHRNVGVDGAPVFSAQYTWLQAAGAPAEVPIYCCVAASPVIADLDVDGVADLISGSYDPGAVFWFRGLGQGKFGERHVLIDAQGAPILTHLESFATCASKSWCSIPALVDWNNDGKPDLITGNLDGEVFVRLSQGTEARVPGYTALPSQPVFVAHYQQTEVTIDRRNAVQEMHAAPSAADWDGDGLFDIIVGTYTGSVYLLRNTGKLGEPKFETSEQLLPMGIGCGQRLVAGHEPQRGIRAQIQAVDYNLDGKMDLLVGDWSNTTTTRSTLTNTEMAKLITLEKELAGLDAAVGYDLSVPRFMHRGYEQNQLMLKKTRALEKEMAQYLEKHPVAGSTTSLHGFVWVYLRK